MDEFISFPSSINRVTLIGLASLTDETFAASRPDPLEELANAAQGHIGGLSTAGHQRALWEGVRAFHPNQGLTELATSAADRVGTRAGFAVIPTGTPVALLEINEPSPDPTRFGPLTTITNSSYLSVSCDFLQPSVTKLDDLQSFLRLVSFSPPDFLLSQDLTNSTDLQWYLVAELANVLTGNATGLSGQMTRQVSQVMLTATSPASPVSNRRAPTVILTAHGLSHATEYLLEWIEVHSFMERVSKAAETEFEHVIRRQKQVAYLNRPIRWFNVKARLESAGSLADHLAFIARFTSRLPLAEEYVLWLRGRWQEGLSPSQSVSKRMEVGNLRMNNSLRVVISASIQKELPILDLAWQSAKVKLSDIENYARWIQESANLKVASIQAQSSTVAEAMAVASVLVAATSLVISFQGSSNRSDQLAEEIRNELKTQTRVACLTIKAGEIEGCPPSPLNAQTYSNFKVDYPIPSFLNKWSQYR